MKHSFIIMIRRPNVHLKAIDGFMMPLVRGADDAHNALQYWCMTAGFNSLHDAAEACQCSVKDISAIQIGK